MNKREFHWLPGVIFWTITACANDPNTNEYDPDFPIRCTAEIRSGLVVFVNSPSQSGAMSVSIQDGSFDEYLEPMDVLSSPGRVVFQGALERPGRYDVRVLRDGVVVRELRGVVVSSNLCHVETRELTFDLEVYP